MELKTHQPCPDCGSSDALAYYEWGTKCFSCDESKPYRNGEQMPTQPTQVIKMQNENPSSFIFSAIPDRKLSIDTCKKYGVSVSKSGTVIDKHMYSTTTRMVIMLLPSSDAPVTSSSGLRVIFLSVVCLVRISLVRQVSLSRCARVR